MGASQVFVEEIHLLAPIKSRHVWIPLCRVSGGRPDPRLGGDGVLPGPATGTLARDHHSLQEDLAALNELGGGEHHHPDQH